MSDHVRKCRTCGTYSDGQYCNQLCVPLVDTIYKTHLMNRPINVDQLDMGSLPPGTPVGAPIGTAQSVPNQAGLTLPIDSQERKDVPLLSGCLRYFPAALAGVARISKAGNDKHNPGQEMHHARGKSADHGDCILRHLMDLQDLLKQLDCPTPVGERMILTEASSLAWRALALSQELHERFGAPLAPGAKLPAPPPTGLKQQN
jgi:hypothetical protein